MKFAELFNVFFEPDICISGIAHQFGDTFTFWEAFFRLLNKSGTNHPDQFQLVVTIKNRELIKPESLGEMPHHIQAKAVKSAGPDVVSRGADLRLQPTHKLARRPSSKGQGQNSLGIDALGDQMGSASNNGTGFACPGTGQYQQVPSIMMRCFGLVRVELHR